MAADYRSVFLWFLASLLAGLVMVSNESIWIDEGQTLRFAQQTTLEDWRQTLLANTKSEAQMPAGMFVAWACARLIGTGEWELRAINLLWVALAGVAIGWVGRLTGKRGLLGLFLLQPFVWYYANEARPYAMQICSSAWLLYVLVRLQSPSSVSPSDLWILCLATAVGAGASLAFSFCLLAVLIVAFWLVYRRKADRRVWSAKCWLPVATTAAVLIAYGVYYLYTLRKGASGARIWPVTPLNFAFASYEILGFSGLGPPRHELRELGRAPGQLVQNLLLSHYFWGLTCLSVLYGLVAARLWKRRGDSLVRLAFAVVLLTSGILYAAASVVHFPFWGRHMAPVLPFVVLLIGVAVLPEPNLRKRLPGYAIPILFAAALTASSLMLRFSSNHQKDDYRTACRLAARSLAAGKVVWWSADSEEVASYYRLSQEKVPAGSARLVFCINPAAETLLRWPLPDVVFRSKPDIYDVQNNLLPFLAKSHYQNVRRLPAFTIWVNPNSEMQPALQ